MGVVLDIGGNMGLFTLWADSRLRNGRIIVFEPIPDLMNMLKHNTRHCRKQDHIRTKRSRRHQRNSCVITYYPHAKRVEQHVHGETKEDPSGGQLD